MQKQRYFNCEMNGKGMKNVPLKVTPETARNYASANREFNKWNDKKAVVTNNWVAPVPSNKEPEYLKAVLAYKVPDVRSIQLSMSSNPTVQTAILSEDNVKEIRNTVVEDKTVSGALGTYSYIVNMANRGAIIRDVGLSVLSVAIGFGLHAARLYSNALPADMVMVVLGPVAVVIGSAIYRAKKIKNAALDVARALQISTMDAILTIAERKAE